MNRHYHARNNAAARAAAWALGAALLFSPLFPAGAVKAEAAAAAPAQAVPSQAASGLSEGVARGAFIAAIADSLGWQAAGTDNPFADLTPQSPYYAAALALAEQGVLTDAAVRAAAPLSEADAVYIAVKAAGLKELAYTYPEAKIRRAWAKLGLDYDSGHASFTLQAAQEIAAAADNGLIPRPDSEPWDYRQPATGAYAAELLDRIKSFRGLGANALGSTSDPDIFGKLWHAWNAQSLIQSPELQHIVDTALQQNLVTGYNLKDSRYNANFDPALSITYGHDSIDHAIQLIGLLRSEGLEAKVQLEPKTSAFIYMKEWGEPVQTDSYRVVQIDNGHYIAYAKEYDLVLEFADSAQKQRFQDIVLQYAKKNSDDAQGLIVSSWWQPLYYSATELSDYELISSNVIREGHLYAQSFSLNEHSPAIAAGFEKLAAGKTAETYTFWVDEPFYRYLQGEAQ